MAPTGFYGKDELDGLQIDQILGAVSDVYSVYVEISYVLQGAERVSCCSFETLSLTRHTVKLLRMQSHCSSRI